MLATTISTKAKATRAPASNRIVDEPATFKEMFFEIATKKREGTR
jgi:hypothetical protein